MEELFYGKRLCSYCLPKARVCAICKEVVIGKSVVRKKIHTICDRCLAENGIEPSSYKGISFWATLRFLVFKRDNFTCRYCGRSPLKDASVELHCDHIIPKTAGGQDTIDNLVTACSMCNLGKRDIILEEAEQELVRARKIYNTLKELEGVV